MTYNSETKKLSYQIADWMLKCSGSASSTGTVYVTEGYGFLCVPRNIVERLVTYNRIFEEADAWLDLWCHTTYEDFGNAFSFLAPAVQYGKYGAALSLETLGRRWGWEKTKVWRFFKKHADVFSLHRLPGSYGCLIFNMQYPVGEIKEVPSDRDILRIFEAVRAVRALRNPLSKGNEGLNRMIAWHSRTVIAEMAGEDHAAPVKNRVALLNSYIRAYFSHGRNCKNCKSCKYDCQGSYLEHGSLIKRGNEIRGPCT